MIKENYKRRISDCRLNLRMSNALKSPKDNLFFQKI